VVLDGALTERGMVSFRADYSPVEVDHKPLSSVAHDLPQSKIGPPPGPRP
jgi:hypothetical protein